MWSKCFTMLKKRIGEENSLPVIGILHIFTGAYEVTARSSQVVRFCALAITTHGTKGFALRTLYVHSVKQTRLQVTFNFYWNWSQTYSLEETGRKPWPICLQLYEMLLWHTDMNVCYFLSWWWETHLDLHLLCCKAKFSFILTVYFGPKVFPLVSKIPLTVQLIPLAWIELNGIKDSQAHMTIIQFKDKFDLRKLKMDLFHK